MIGRIIDLIGVSVRDPGAAIAALKGLGVGRRESWLTIFLAASVGAIMSCLLMRTLPGAEAGMDRLASQPMGMALLQVGAAALFAALVDRVGRLFGGTGRFDDALLVTAWIEVAMLVVQIPQILISIALPAIGGILSLLSFALYFVLAVQLIRAVHGFRNPLLVALGIVGTVFVAGFALSLLAASLGIMPEVFA
ncbi:Yip1 family protein [Paracoccus aeridis]|uniref:Yip1 family protein n=1 Tax=Paracoccus aeridis TaxID=1966466 RepID=UPI0010AAA44E|nr:Yip1 family protein [Paracoccus aeridis]